MLRSLIKSLSIFLNTLYKELKKDLEKNLHVGGALEFTAGIKTDETYKAFTLIFGVQVARYYQNYFTITR